MPKRKAPAKLRKIVAKAKAIRKKSPRKKWQTCVKEAARKVK